MPLDGVALPRGDDVPPLYLLHGTDDTVVPADGVVRFQQACAAVGVACDLTLVATDHAGVIGAEYAADRRECVPSMRPAAQIGLAAALSVIGLAAGR